jgi:hypothetical protein
VLRLDANLGTAKSKNVTLRDALFNSNYNPQKEDVNSFFEVLDVDRNKKVTIEDMEQLCIRYLTGTTLGVPYKFNEGRANRFA